MFTTRNIALGVKKEKDFLKSAAFSVGSKVTEKKGIGLFFVEFGGILGNFSK